ncbi:DUF5610 domain-containing protein [Reinekea thalattae]|uniref:DUF5610 domain-containing protein n=1 Tax=Reinekea thalattae TaxID=2593301 RepID=A0A5C8Z5M9_9GAMM|nr:DUF5610 domain-containing protein [Reinekea thalattae]TXR53425.1 hypothetical protein FME95_02320 [Reinekea thalattae]
MNNYNLGSGYYPDNYASQYQYGSANSKLQSPEAAQKTEASSTEQTDSTSRADNFNVDALVDQLWSFASSRVAKAEADGASEEDIAQMWQDAASGIEKGFSEAKEVLEGMELLDEPLKMKIDSAYGQLVDKIDESLQALSGDVLIEPKEKASTTYVSASYVETSSLYTNRSSSSQGINAYSQYQYQSQTFELDLVTKEGDKIQIRSAVTEENYAAYGSDNSASSVQWGASGSSDYSLYIEGDLSDEERADLEALLEQVNELANEFYNGDLNTAFSMAQQIGIDGTSLKSMDLSMTEVEASRVGSYVSNVPESDSTSLPKGLEPLKDYADRLLAEQLEWQSKFESDRGLLTALLNHPMNQGDLGDFVSQMLGE